MRRERASNWGRALRKCANSVFVYLTITCCGGNKRDLGAISAEHAQSTYISQVQCLCPAEATKRGLGAVLLRKPQKLARLVAGIAAGSPIPFTVKLRIGTGEKGSNINILEVCSVLGRPCSCWTLLPAQRPGFRAQLVQAGAAIPQESGCRHPGRTHQRPDSLTR